MTNFYRLKFLSHHKISFHKSHNGSENVLYLKTCLSTYMWLIFPGRSKWPLFSIYNSKHNSVSGEHDQRPGLSEVCRSQVLRSALRRTIHGKRMCTAFWDLTQRQLAQQACALFSGLPAALFSTAHPEHHEHGTGKLEQVYYNF